jgi:hypothetical protein
MIKPQFFSLCRGQLSIGVMVSGFQRPLSNSLESRAYLHTASA